MYGKTGAVVVRVLLYLVSGLAAGLGWWIWDPNLARAGIVAAAVAFLVRLAVADYDEIVRERRRGRYDRTA